MAAAELQLPVRASSSRLKKPAQVACARAAPTATARLVARCSALTSAAVQVWTLAAQPPPAASDTPAAATAAQCTQQQELQDERSTRLNAAAMLWLKAALVLLLAAAVAISGSLSYTLGAHRCTRFLAGRAPPNLTKPPLRSSLRRRFGARAGHNAELLSMWRAFDAAGRSMQNNFQAVLDLKASGGKGLGALARALRSLNERARIR
jgi:hypothetical protein